MSVCQIEERDAGRGYPRTCPTCGLSGVCFKGLDRRGLMARIEALEAELASGSFYKESDIDAWQNRIEALEVENARLRDATNQARLAFAGYVSVDSAVRKLDTLAERAG